MRITNKMITTKYIKSFSQLSYNLDKLNTKVITGREFMKASENPAAAIKAFQIRGELSSIENYDNNISHARSSLKNAESALLHIQELSTDVKGKLVTALNGTQSSQEREILATEIKNIQEQLFQALNSNASNIYYFGGANTDTKPFSVDEATGDLLYNKVNLNLPQLDPADAAYDPDYDAALKRLTTESMYVDIGMGIQFNATNEIERHTVFEYSIPGINIVGSGVTMDGTLELPNNLYNLLGDIADKLTEEPFPQEELDKLMGHFDTKALSILNRLTDVGAKSSYLDFVEDRYASRTLDMQERQMSVEGADPAKTIIEFNSMKASYLAALQMGTHLIQPSIFDFMR
ncbi:MAG: hypothetical protein PHW03_07180 [Eubacteriales bacterium]|nr:hypothetical protein [Eubacteriales bacterium]